MTGSASGCRRTPFSTASSATLAWDKLLFAAFLHQDTIARQGGDLLAGEAVGTQHRLTMLVEAWRRASGATRRARQFDRRTEAPIGAEFRHHLAMRGMVGC